MRRGFKNTMSHRAEVKGNNKLYEDEKEEDLCPCLFDVRESLVKEEKEKGNFYEQGQQDERPYIP